MQTNTPIPVITQVASISIQNVPSPPGITVTEGLPFPYPIAVKLQCSSASACANRRVYASLDSISGNRVRKVQFSSFFNVPPKILYNVTATTDSNGVASFAALQFSVSGPASAFQISFVCDGVYSSSSLSGMIASTVEGIYGSGNVNFTDVCGNLQSNAANGSMYSSFFDSLNVISSAGQFVQVSLNLGVYSSSFGPVPDKSANVVFLSALPGLDFQCTQTPIISANDGSFWVNLSFSPFGNGNPLNGSANLVISVDNVNITFPFIFSFNSSYQSSCGLASVISPSPSLCQSGGFISVFQGSYQSASMKAWTPWLPGSWSSARAFSLNFILNSFSVGVSPFVCNSTLSSSLLVLFPIVVFQSNPIVSVFISVSCINPDFSGVDTRK